MQRIALIIKHFPRIKQISGVSNFSSVLADELSKICDLHVFSCCEKKMAKKVNAVKRYELHSVHAPFWWQVGAVVGHEFEKVIILSGIYKTKWLYPILMPIIAGLTKKVQVYFYQCTVWEGLPGKLFIKLLDKCKGVFCTNENLSRQLMQVMGLKCVFIPPGIDLLRINNKKVLRKSDFVRIGYINHFSKEKGFDLALEAFSKLKLDNSEYVIAGAGPLEKIVTKKYSTYSNMKFLGYVEDPISLIKSCDFIVLPFRTSSSVLGISQTVLEAMACGVPIIGSNTDVITSVVTNGKEGVIFNDPIQLVGCIKQLYKDSQMRSIMSKQAAQKAKEYASNKLANKIYNIVNGN